MKLKLEQLEANLQKLVEDHLVGILPGLKLEDRVIQHLATAIRENIVQQKNDSPLAPNVFTLIVSTDTSPMWKEQRTIDTLKNIITTAGREAGLKFVGQPIITITTDDTYSAEEVRVVASHKLEPVAETQGMQNPVSGTVPEDNSGIPENAFLIIEGVKVHPLNEAVVNIGRRLENQLVIDDPRVSRNHAQLRAIKGRFVLFDLNSTGGTFVNGQRTSQTVLYPGDVISLAGVALIFGQDSPPPRPDLASTSPLDLDPGKNERPTAALSQVTVEIKPDKKRSPEDSSDQ
ncbi:MAG TPA: FhaA domain-containing protein [Anaerolineales bacterium]|nr:FhaA domain-containing protein [Anaerolineales bacterium]